MDLSYAVTPLIAWFVAGLTKFGINCVRARRLAFDLIGYGGLPSNHSAIVSSIATLIALKEGVSDPAFGVALALAMVVMFDASSLRRQVGRQAALINRLLAERGETPGLRERMGHSRLEILAGIVLGMGVAAGVDHLLG